MASPSPAKKEKAPPEKASVSVEQAKSNRSTCKGCNEKIEKGVLRVGMTTIVKQAPMTRWFHVLCWNIPKKGFKDSEKGVDAIDGYEGLDAAEKQLIKDKLDGAAPKKRPAEGGDDKPKKKKKKGEESEVDVEAIQQKYNKMTSTSLKTVLRNNLQGGFSALRKEQLVEKCVDGEIYGALPRCPLCKMSCVQVAADKDGFEIFTCPGYFDSERSYRVTCKFREEQVERIKPWLQLTDTPRPDPDAPQPKPKSVQDPDGYKGLGIKDAIPKLLAAAEASELMSIPKNNISDVNIQAATALNATKGEDGSWKPDEALELLAKKFPKATKDESSSKVPANDPLCAVLDELATYEMKENMFKGTSIRKGVDALRQLDFVVTSGKALAAGKSKVPGIGKGIGERIDEFLETGKIEVLEGYRIKHG